MSPGGELERAGALGGTAAVIDRRILTTLCTLGKNKKKEKYVIKAKIKAKYATCMYKIHPRLSYFKL